MKLRQLFTLLLILAVLGAAIYLKSQQKPAELASEEYMPLDLSFDEAKVEKIKIEKTKDGKTNSAEIVKKDGRWTVPAMFDARADESKIRDFLDAVKNAKGELRGKGKDIFKDFEIEGPGSFQIELSPASGKPVLELVIGNKSAGPDSTFVRKKDSESVYLVEGNLLAMTGIYAGSKQEKPALSFWAATDFLKLDANQVRALEIKTRTNGKETLKAGLKREGGKWKFTRAGLPFPASDERVRAFLDSLKEINAEKVLHPQAKDYGFADPAWTMTVTMDDGKTKVFNGGKREEKDGAVYMQSLSEPVAFQVPKTQFAEIDVDDAYFIADNPLGVVSADQTEKLTVRAGKEEYVLRPASKKWTQLEDYLEMLKNLRFDSLLSDGKPPKMWPYSLEFQAAGKPSMILDAAGGPSYAAAVRGNGTLFVLSEISFKQLFEDLGRLKEPAMPPKKS